MNFKTLLLGSAAAFAFAAGNAQAADLSVAEPVDYVRVCDAFGAGYWYIPGGDTCISISGKIETGVKFGDNFPDYVREFDDNDNGIVDRTEEVDDNWGFYTDTDVTVDARSMTDWGPLVGYITMTATHGYDEADFSIDEAFVSLGPLLIGYTQSIFDVQGGGYTDSGLDLTDNDISQVQLSWAFNGFGLAIAVEDPQERFGTLGEDVPALAAAITTEMGGWDAAVSFLYAPNEVDDTVGVEGVVSTEFGIWEFQLGAVWLSGLGLETDYANGDGVFGGEDFTGEGWAVALSGKQNWQSNFYTAETVVFADMDYASDWSAAFTVGYSPVDSLWFVADASTVDEGDSWDFVIYAEKTFGPNG